MPNHKVGKVVVRASNVAPVKIVGFNLSNGQWCDFYARIEAEPSSGQCHDCNDDKTN